MEAAHQHLANDITTRWLQRILCNEKWVFIVFIIMNITARLLLHSINQSRDAQPRCRHYKSCVNDGQQTIVQSGHQHLLVATNTSVDVIVKAETTRFASRGPQPAGFLLTGSGLVNQICPC